jgi:hypothetical protein
LEGDLRVLVGEGRRDDRQVYERQREKGDSGQGKAKRGSSEVC